MKYIKIYENKKYEKFMVTEFPDYYNDPVYQVWELQSYSSQFNSFSIRKRYEYTKDEGLYEETDKSYINFPESQIYVYDDVVYKTNTIEKALEFVNMKINAIKYNL